MNIKKSIIILLLIASSQAYAEVVEPSEEDTSLAKVVEQQEEAVESPFGISFYRPTYIMPYYYTGEPYADVYRGSTPDNQSVKPSEFKWQLSFHLPLVKNMFDSPYTLEVAYTQMAYWQTYTSSQWFRETNYEPEIFVQRMFNPRFLGRLGVNHESNGRGGALERSWNRAIVELVHSGQNWLLSVKAWALIFKPQSADLHNPDIADFLGHEEIRFSYNLYDNVITAEIHNIEHPSKAGYELSWSYPINKHFKWYLRGFSGYGQSLIEYNHRTNSIGVGIALSDWI